MAFKLLFTNKNYTTFIIFSSYSNIFYQKKQTGYNRNNHIKNNFNAQWRRKIDTIIFDLDDTLIKTSKIYNLARSEFSSLMVDLGFLQEEVLNKLDEIDISHISRHGFAKERYPFSLVKTYHHYCRKAEIKINREIEKKVAEIGWKVFSQVPEKVEGVEDVLNYLKNRYSMLLATLGDPEIQHKKIFYSGLRPYFSSVYVLNQKSVEEYSKIIQEHNLKKKKTWLIGNSVRSDLNPGLKLGLNCILIPAVTWKFEEEKPVANDYLRLEKLTEILNYL
jgi:putative hydrolase of the HAD superfamily